MSHPESTEPGRSPGVVSVAAVTDAGPRQVNEDRMFTAVSIASDGVWEPLAVRGGGMEWLWDDSPTGIGSACDPEAVDASGIAEGILTKARLLGLDGNATVAVAHRRRSPER